MNFIKEDNIYISSNFPSFKYLEVFPSNVHLQKSKDHPLPPFQKVDQINHF